MKGHRTNKAKHPAGFRYDKRTWLPIVREMLDAGALYAEIGQRLGVGNSTVCRFVWENQLVNHHEHRNSVRSKMLKAPKITPEVMHYQSIQVTKHQDDIRRGLRPKEGRDAK